MGHEVCHKPTFKDPVKTPALKTEMEKIMANLKEYDLFIYLFIFIYYNEGNTPTMQQIPDLEVNRVQHS